MALDHRLPGEENEHVASSRPLRVHGVDGRQAVLSLMVDKEQCIEEVSVLVAAESMLWIQLVPAKSVLCIHGVHVCDRAVLGHVLAAEERGHGEVHPVTMHAF